MSRGIYVGRNEPTRARGVETVVAVGVIATALAIIIPATKRQLKRIRHPIAR